MSDRQTIAVIQARMGSTRFPGKVLFDIRGHTVIDRVIEGVRKSKEVTRIIVATTTLESDTPLVNYLMKRYTNYEIGIYRGSSSDVLGRFYGACFNLDDNDEIVRITADCPLVSGEMIDDICRLRRYADAPYASNVHPPTFPDGLDVEVFTFSALENAFEKATLQSEREHVTPYIWKTFKTANLLNSLENMSEIRVTVDYPDDAEYIGELLDQLSDHQLITPEKIRNAHKLVTDNRKHERNEGYELSLQNDVCSSDSKEK